MTDSDIISLLAYYGHLQNPFGEPRDIATPVESLKLTDQVVHDAIQSYQSMHAVAMEPIIAAFYPERTSAAVRADGDAGPATRRLLETARCAVPDYDMSLSQEMVGNGNWKGCHGIGNYHSCKVRFLNEPPAFLAGVFPAVWDRTVDAYAELGLLFSRDDTSPNRNTDLSFVQPNGGWIGLAIVGQGETCSTAPIWLKFDHNYKPANLLSEWTSLVKHELGHNCGLGHSSGGVMNPYIIPGLPVSWKNDVSYPLLKARFGGEPVPRIPKTREVVVAFRYPDNSFEVITVLPTSGSTWPT